MIENLGLMMIIETNYELDHCRYSRRINELAFYFIVNFSKDFFKSVHFPHLNDEVMALNFVSYSIYLTVEYLPSH